MNAAFATSPADLHHHLARGGFAFVAADDMQSLLGGRHALHDWNAFAASWRHLGLDSYLAAQGRRRRRRYAVFTMDATAGIQRARHQPHYQRVDYNTLQGGIERWFEPMEDTVAACASLARILDFARASFGALASAVRCWRVEVHQFRIEASSDLAGEPTPEGVHRDGVDYVLVLMVDRVNIERGTTTIHAPDGAKLGSFTLAQPLDAALVDDRRVFHGVTPVVPIDPSQPAYRDVLVATYRAIG